MTNELDPEKRERVEQVVVFVLGSMQDLHDAGLLAGAGGDLAPRGISRYDQLRASGFRPTDGEIDIMMSALARKTGVANPPEVVDLLKRYARDELPGLNY